MFIIICVVLFKMFLVCVLDKLWSVSNDTSTTRPLKDLLLQNDMYPPDVQSLITNAELGLAENHFALPEVRIII